MDSAPRKVCVLTFGCQMNKLDSELVRGELRRSGFALTADPAVADVVIYNTCSVRAHAEDKAFSHLGSYRRRAEQQPGFVVGVMGCMAQRLGHQIVERFPFVRLVCGTGRFLDLPDQLQQVLATGRTVIRLGDPRLCPPERTGRGRVLSVRNSRHTACVAVMRGCDNFCAYCVVPYLRGKESSRPLEDILGEIDALARDGVREVTLLGQSVSGYGRDLKPPVGLADLLRAADGMDRLERIRFITSHPGDIDEPIISAVAELGKVCEHLHLPAQSGSDTVLSRMKRGYTCAEYRAVVDRLRARVPDVEVASDFIVGFPGETDDDFAATLRLLEQTRFQQSFVFKYSPRPGTLAARWQDDVPDEVKRQRNQTLLHAQEQIDRERRHGLVGRSVQVLVEGPSKGDPTRLSGRTRQNDIVVFKGAERLEGELLTLKVVGSTALTLFGEPAHTC
jgi:tRNA-2-methylthio-N6-dimethylallyladenosine synthase